MDTKRLVSFLKSAELGSLSAAAEELGYTPSAVSQLVASLEKEFGVQLLVRTTRGVYPTPEAKGLMPLIEAYLKSEDHIYEYIDGIKGMSEGTLTITAYPSIATIWLPEVVSRFIKDYPGININIMECSRPDILRNLDEGIAEMAFLIYAEPMPFEWIPLAEEEMVAVIPSDHPLANGDAYPISRIEEDNFILSSLGQEPEVLNLLADHGIQPEIKFTTYDTPVNLALVQRGLGVSIVNELSIRNRSGNFVKMPLDPPQKVTYGIALKSIDNLTEAARIFLDYSVRYLTRSAK